MKAMMTAAINAARAQTGDLPVEGPVVGAWRGWLAPPFLGESVE